MLSSFNKKTYKIDDIDWESTPECFFETRPARGETEPGRTSFLEYYLKRYQIRIRDTKQCMLVSRVKNEHWNPETRSKERREQIVKLIPELCCITGNAIKDGVANPINFQRDLDAHTKMAPHVRFEKLKQFLAQISDARGSREELENWDIRLARQMMSVRGKRLPTVSIFFGADRVEEQTDQGWDRTMRDAQLLRTVPLRKWMLFYARREEYEAKKFESELISLAMKMGFRVESATW